MFDEKNSKKMTKVVFLSILIYAILMTAIWAYFLISGEESFSFIKRSDFSINKDTINKITYRLLFIYGIWSYAFYLLKYFLLKKIGFEKDDLKKVFSSRQSLFNLQNILSKHSERKIRIIDMISRRGRTLPLLSQGFLLTYLFLEKSSTQSSFIIALERSMVISLVFLWIHIIAFYMDNILGRILYGAHTRIMDGVSGRANVLFILALWQNIQFIMIPLGLVLISVFPSSSYVALYAMIWLPYILVDLASEVFGSILGKQKIKVLGIGDVNRKSLSGTFFGLAFGIITALIIVFISAVPSSWFILAILVAFLSTITELYAPRPSDDFFLVIVNALVCLIFGIIIY